MVNYQKAIEIIDNYQFTKKTTSISSLDSLGYILAEDVTSAINVPSFRKSAMDGYALKRSNNLDATFTIIDTIYAGDNKNPPLRSDWCVSIMTGAPIPDDADFVIVKELAKRTANTVTFNIPTTKLNANICQIGEDIKAGELLFKRNTRITPSTISSLVSCGTASVCVYAKPRILLLTTGDEVVSGHALLQRGQIYNSNLGFLKPRLTELGFECEHIHLSDDQSQLDNVLTTDYDLIISTGAISVGDKDIFRNFINDVKPRVLFDRVNIMPGGPVVFWEYKQVPIISLAGSPFANFVTFELFARRILSHLTNDRTLIAKQRQLRLSGEYQKKLKKRRFLKAKISGDTVTIPSDNHLASSMHEMTMCNALINLERGDINLKSNDIAHVIDLRRIYE